MSGLIIRPLHHDDRAAWAVLWEAYLAFYGTSVIDAVYETYFARLLGDDPRDFSAFVAEKDGALIGLTHYLVHRHGWRVEDVIYLQDLYVVPDARGTGAGRALIEAVYAAGDAAGCPTVYWLTQEGNATARQLYDRIATPTDFMKYQR
ncbi:MAG: GNAT family N-acetyltransferase [Pseudomonadota bacterium]